MLAAMHPATRNTNKKIFKQATYAEKFCCSINES